MKQKMNVNGDIESRRRIAERRSVPARENISPDNSQQYHGTFKRFPFDQTRIGFMLRYEMPVVYHLLRRLYDRQQPFEPNWHVIELVAEASKDPSFRKAKFSRYLDEYRRNGVYCRRGKRLTPGRKTYYEGIRRRKTEEYIRQNRRKLLFERRNGPGSDKLPGEIKNILKMKR